MCSRAVRVPNGSASVASRPSKSGGQLIIASPYTWLESYTPRGKWLGGFKRGGRAVGAFDVLRQILSPQFKLSQRRDLCFLLREHARKFQLGVSEATIKAHVSAILQKLGVESRTQAVIAAAKIAGGQWRQDTPSPQ